MYSQTTEWLEEEEALLDEITFSPQLTNNHAVHSYETRTPLTNYDNGNHNLQGEKTCSLNQTSLSSTVPITNHQRSIMEIPEAYRSIFNYSRFNRMQSEAMNQLLYSDENLVISAPTGTGKTVLLEMAMIRCLSVQQQQTGIKMVYMAPTKSLCAEKFKDWSQSFGPLGLKCQEFTGDSDYATINAIKNSDIIVTTPEKWDAMTRRWNNHKTLISMVKLIMIDEIHILKENRGAILEVCVSRMKYMDHNMRFVAVSATVPNLGDITAWLGASALTFSEEYRPIKLDRFVYGYPLKGGNYYAFEKSLDWKLLDIITKHSENKPVLIFCSTRGAAQSACETLLKHMKQKNMTPSDSPPVNVGLKNKKLSGLVLQGIGFHHAGLDIGDRRMVEKLFLDRQIRIVATTSTLAIGVNLPAHLVIIKSTKGYHNGALEEYSDIDILQMIGRSGRLGLDTSGCAVIMTTTDMESKLKSLVSCQTTIESSLHQNLTEHLMSEVCIGTIMDLESSVKWLKSTFLFIRVKQNPVYYQLLCSNDSLANNPTDQIMNDICLKDMKLLKDHHLVTSCDTGLNSKLQATFYGTTMDRFYIKFKTMISIIKPKNWNSIKDVLELVSQATEFEPYRYNANEKSALNFLRSKPDIRFPLKSKVSSISDKVFIIIQCVLGDISLYNSLLGNTLTSASHAIIEKASRITKCIIECAAYEKNSIKLKHSLDLYQCLKAKMWSNSPFILKQIEDIGIQTVKTLSQKNISTFQQLRDCDPCQLELILHRNPPFGTKIKNHLSSFPNYYLDLQQKPCQTPPQEQPTIELTVTVGLLTPLKKLGSSYGKGSQTVLWIETSDHVLIDFRRIWTQHLIKRHSQLVFPVQVTSSSMMISCHVQSEDYVGLDSIKEIKPDVDPMQFITLTKQWTEPQAPTSLEAQHDIAMEAQQVTTDFLSNVEDWMVETSDTVTIKAESPESPWTKPTLPTLPKEKPCKHQCKDKRRCKHQCCKRGINNASRHQTPVDTKDTNKDSDTHILHDDNDLDSNNKRDHLSINSTNILDRPSLDLNAKGTTTHLSPRSSTPCNQQVMESYLSLPTSTRSSPTIDITGGNILENTIDLNLDTPQPSPTKSEDMDYWDIFDDDKMDDVLYSMTLDAEKGLFSTKAGTTDHPIDYGTRNIGSNNDVSSMDNWNHDMHYEDVASSDIDSCNWLWDKLAHIVYDEQTKTHLDFNDNISIQAHSTPTRTNNDSSSFMEDMNPCKPEHTQQTPTLLKWLQTHVITTID